MLGSRFGPALRDGEKSVSEEEQPSCLALRVGTDSINKRGATGAGQVNIRWQCMRYLVDGKVTRNVFRDVNPYPY